MFRFSVNVQNSKVRVRARRTDAKYWTLSRHNIECIFSIYLPSRQRQRYVSHVLYFFKYGGLRTCTYFIQVDVNKTGIRVAPVLCFFRKIQAYFHVFCFSVRVSQNTEAWSYYVEAAYTWRYVPVQMTAVSLHYYPTVKLMKTRAKRSITSLTLTTISWSSCLWSSSSSSSSSPLVIAVVLPSCPSQPPCGRR